MEFPLLKAYGWLLIMLMVGGASFFVAEFIRRGGTREKAVAAMLRLALFFPISISVLLYADQIQWLPRIVWRIYLVCIAAYLLNALFSPRFSSMRSNVKDKIQELPMVGPLIIWVLAIVFLPAFVILCQYAFLP